MGFALSLVTIGILSTSTLSILNDNYSSTNNTPSDSTAQLYSSSGAAGGHSFTKPFILTDAQETNAYIGSDGYLYVTAQYWGSGTFYKQSNLGQTASNPIVDYDFDTIGYGLAVLEDGTVKGAASGENSTKTWTTLKVNSKDTGSTNPAIGVSIQRNSSNQLILMEDDSLYSNSKSTTNMTSCVVTADTSSSRDGIVDFTTGVTYAFVLYGNGDLYRSSNSNTSSAASAWTLVAQDVEMFDYESYSSNSNIYVYDELGNVKTSASSRSLSDSWTTLVSNNYDVVQIRGSGSGYHTGWGFLTSDGTLRTFETSISAVWTGSNETRKVTGVDYFDVATWGTWGYLKDNKMYMWNNKSSITTSSSTPVTVSNMTNATNTDFTIEDLAGNGRGLSNTPPATKFFFKKMYFFRIKIYILI